MNEIVMVDGTAVSVPEIAVLHAAPGRVFVLHVPERLSEAAVDRILQQWRAIVRDTPLIVLDGGKRLEAVDAGHAAGGQ